MSLFDRAMTAAQTGDPQMGYALLVAAARERPEDAEAWYRLGCALGEAKRHEAAVGCLARADLLRPGHARTLLNLGWELHLCGRGEEGAAALVTALTYDKTLALGWTDLSAVRIGGELKGCVVAPIDLARRAVELEPHIALHHVQLAMALFHAGEWEEGFREFEWRLAWKMPETLRYPYPLWRSEKVGTLFLQAEQGLGDSLMALRWIEACEGRAARTVLFVQPELRRFFVERLPWAEVGTTPGVLPAADAWCPLMSLPAALGLGAPACADHTFEVGRRYRRIAIAWSGNPAHESAALRDVPLAALLRFAEIPGMTLHSFQVGPGQKELDRLGCHALVEDLSPRLIDMQETVEALENIDLVICCDTALGHLAGVLGKPCWLLVNQRACDWRWGMTGEGSVWYPQHRIWRRGREEGWEAVIERMAVELRG